MLLVLLVGIGKCRLNWNFGIFVFNYSNLNLVHWPEAGNPPVLPCFATNSKDGWFLHSFETLKHWLHYYIDYFITLNYIIIYIFLFNNSTQNFKMNRFIKKYSWGVRHVRNSFFKYTKSEINDLPHCTSCYQNQLLLLWTFLS